MQQIRFVKHLSASANTYQQVNDTIHNVLQQQDSALDSAYGLNNNDGEFNCLPCTCWLPKMHKILFGARFITAGKKCINKQTKQACYISIQDMLQPNR